MAGLDYAKSGVNREAADALVDRIAVLSRSTLNRRVKSSIGGYASLFELDKKRWLAASTDGVGTKLKFAFMSGEHRTVGIDLVAMSVNDLLCVGARPLFFLDYFATGKLNSGIAEQVLEGIVAGCKDAGCALVGGETAEMPDFYANGEYDLGGFAVGEVSPREVLPKKTVRRGDVLIGISSTGCHSNGFSLLRKLLEKDGNSTSRIQELLTPTRIYARALLPLMEQGWIKGMAHITGSGFLNVPRISDQVSYQIELPLEVERPSVFDWVKKQSGLPLSERATTFNLGLGMVLVAAPKDADRILMKLKRAKEKAWIVGEVIARKRGGKSEVTVIDGAESAVLEY